MTIREKIINIIAEARGQHADTYYIPDSDYADKILLLLERRITDIIDKQLKQVQYDLKHYSDSSEYWLLHGKAYMLTELKDKINES